MPKPIKKRVQKKSADTEQEVKDKLVTLKDTIKKRQKHVFMYGVGILVIIIALVGFLFYNASLKKSAGKFGYEAYQIYHGVSPIQFINKEDRYRKAMDLFQKAYDSKKSPISLFYIAGCQYELGKYDEALKTLKDFLQRYSDKDRFIPLAYQKMAMVYIKKGDTNEAMKMLDTLYTLKGDIYKDFALMEHARLLEKGGKLEEAKKKYKELTDKFPNSPFSEEAKVKLSGKKEG